MSTPENASWTLLCDGAAHALALQDDAGAWRLSPEDLLTCLGWELRPEGLCRGDVCVPVRDAQLSTPQGVDLQRVADALGRPLALDAETHCAALGTAAADRAAALAGEQAPDFELPDLSGRKQRLSDWRGKKVLLIAYASW